MYIEETKKRFDAINSIEDENERSEAIKNINGIIEESRERYRKYEEKLNSIKKERVGFVTTHKFYPRDYASRITLIEVELERIEEYIKVNPLKPTRKTEQLISEEEEIVGEFIKVKDEVDTLLPLMEGHEKTLKSDEDSLGHFLKKQDLFLSLQKGDIAKVKKLITYFKGKLKN